MLEPYHPVPDGSVALSHHYTWALVLALIPLLVVWDDHPGREPWLALSAVVVGLLAFLIVWPTHHTLGAALALAAPVVALTALLYRGAFESDLWALAPLAVAGVLVLVALDDVVQHATGWPTPLDWVWKTHLRPMLPSH